MKQVILFLSLLFILSFTACNRSPQPVPLASTAKLTLSMIGNTGLAPAGFGKGAVTFSPAPQSGNAKCNLVGNDPITCTANFAPGAMVRLAVIPEDSRLEKIDGCEVIKCEGCLPGETICQLTMNGDKSVTAVLIGNSH